MKNYRLIGLTGGTGSGKSIVREVFAENGYSVIDADILARKALDNRILVGDIMTLFGADLMKADGLDRRELARRAFKNSETVKRLNSVTHPYITSLFLRELRELIRSGKTKILFDAPQLFEAELDVICDYTVAVIADRKLRLERIMKRDNISEIEAERRLNIQLTDSFFKENCDFYIENNNSEKELKEKTAGVLSRL